jgi:hypothetical protein
MVPGGHDIAEGNCHARGAERFDEVALRGALYANLLALDVGEALDRRVAVEHLRRPGVVVQHMRAVFLLEGRTQDRRVGVDGLAGHIERLGDAGNVDTLDDGVLGRVDRQPVREIEQAELHEPDDLRALEAELAQRLEVDGYLPLRRLWQGLGPERLLVLLPIGQVGPSADHLESLLWQILRVCSCPSHRDGARKHQRSNKPANHLHLPLCSVSVFCRRISHGCHCLSVVMSMPTRQERVLRPRRIVVSAPA